jgi:aminopeptidase-like protein
MHPDAGTRIVGGLTLSCLGDDHPFTYKRTVGGAATVDRVAAHVLRARRTQHELIDFFPYGYDERQYNSPGFRIPVGSLMRGRHGQFAEYHTSMDNVEFVSGDRIVESLDVVVEIITTLDRNRCYVNTQPYGEPQLGTRGLYGAIGGTTIPDAQMAMLWLLNQSDGRHSLLDVAERSGVPFASLVRTAALLEEHNLLVPA